MKRKASEEEIEKKLLEIIKKSKDGIDRRELWKVSRIKSENGTKFLMKFIKNGSVIQTERYVNGKKIRILKVATKTLKILPLEILNGIPCIPCPDFNNCSELGSLNPINCNKLIEWLEK